MKRRSSKVNEMDFFIQQGAQNFALQPAPLLVVHFRSGIDRISRRQIGKQFSRAFRHQVELTTMAARLP
jgi:hypothetical protein